MDVPPREPRIIGELGSAFIVVVVGSRVPFEGSRAALAPGASGWASAVGPSCLTSPGLAPARRGTSSGLGLAGHSVLLVCMRCLSRSVESSAPSSGGGELGLRARCSGGDSAAVAGFGLSAAGMKENCSFEAALDYCCVATIAAMPPVTAILAFDDLDDFVALIICGDN